MKGLRRRHGRSGRHKVPTITLPEWVERLEDSCLRSVAEDAYLALALAAGLHADTLAASATTYRAGMKSLSRLEDTRLRPSERAAAGNRAARKFWEAKVAARQARRA